MSDTTKPLPKILALNKRERNVCEWIWGGVPVDVLWVRNSKLFQEKMSIFETFCYKWKWPDVEGIKNFLERMPGVIAKPDALEQLRQHYTRAFAEYTEDKWNEEYPIDLWEPVFRNKNKTNGNTERP